MVHVFVFHLPFLLSCSLNKVENHQQTQHPHMSSTPRFDPGSHWWEASALTTAPSLPSKGKIAVAPLSSAQAPAWYPCKNSNKRAGDYAKTLPLFPFPSSTARSHFPSPQSPCGTKRPLWRCQLALFEF